MNSRRYERMGIIIAKGVPDGDDIGTALTMGVGMIN